MKLKAGDPVRWMCPLDHDYRYGKIVSIERGIATVKGTGLDKNITAGVHLRYIEKLAGGKYRGGSKRGSKSYPAKGKL